MTKAPNTSGYDRGDRRKDEMPLFLKPVTHPIKRFDHVEGVVDPSEFLAQALNVAVDCTIIEINLVIVGGIHQSVAALDYTGARGERVQEEELGDGKRHRFIFPGTGVAFLVHP